MSLDSNSAVRRFVMGKKILLGCVTLAALAAAGPSVAADMRAAPAPVYTKAPMMVPAFNWTGCYGGGHAGGAWSNDSYTLDNGAGLVEDFSFNPTSWIAGGQLGCQVQASSFVFGVEGTWSGLDLKQTDQSVLSPGRQRSLTIDGIATATARLGITFDRWMIYGKGGWADGRIETFAINPAA
jgi:outer membrane immunogenic protein